MTRKSFDNDKLSREGYAKFIEILLSDTKKYKRDKDTNSFVLAIDSPWGTGKTYFVEMMHEYLEKSASGMQFNTFRYNAWKNDFYVPDALTMPDVTMQMRKNVTVKKV